ncbi:MAG: hypothetical protein SFY80_07725 [Verrucomicrobiota bacterium]|nr:hypothetical protein [Verrucomicrobiota bacterium]
MTEIAIKKQVLAALYEIRAGLNEWHRKLDALGALSDETRAEKKRVRKVIARVDKFVRVRNATFHFGDSLEDSDKLIKLYEQIYATDIQLLNRIIDDLRSLGEKLKNDALSKC